MNCPFAEYYDGFPVVPEHLVPQERRRSHMGRYIEKSCACCVRTFVTSIGEHNNGRKFCSIECRGKAQKGRFLQGDGSPAVGRQRARILYSLGPCERCGRKAIDRHHKDGNPNNNEKANIMFLCRACHTDIDGRARTFHKFRILKQPSKIPCIDCGRLYSPMRKGRCKRCAAKFYYHRQGENLR